MTGPAIVMLCAVIVCLCKGYAGATWASRWLKHRGDLGSPSWHIRLNRAGLAFTLVVLAGYAALIWADFVFRLGLLPLPPDRWRIDIWIWSVAALGSMYSVWVIRKFGH